MAEKINIASLTIDFNDVIKKSSEYKKQIDDLKKSQKELDVTTEAGRTAFVKMDVDIKNLSKSYRDNQSFARALESANSDLEKTMSTQNKSTQELRDSRSQLNQISKNIKGSTEEEIALREELNRAIDEQTEALRKQSSGFNASKDGIGEYKKGIVSAQKELEENKRLLEEQEAALVSLREEQETGSKEWNYYNTQVNETNIQINILASEMGEVNDEMNASSAITKLLSGDIKGLKEQSEKMGGTGKLVTSSLKGMAKGMWGMVKASLAFLLTPLGIFLAVVAGAFLLVKNAMNRSEESTNKIKKAFAAFGGIVKGLLRILEPLGKFLIDGIVKGFELVEKGIFTAMKGIQTALAFLGFDEAAESMKAFNEEVKASAEASKALALAEAELEKSQRIAQKTQLDFQKQAELFRQIRDDESKSIAERIQANEDLGAVLQNQLSTELEIAQKALEVANLRIVAEGKTKEALDEQAEALTQISDIQERITGQESEQLTNRNSLRREAADKAKKIQEDAIKRQNEELELFIQQQGVRARTLEEGLELERKISEKKIEILKAELKSGAISQEKFNAEILAIQNDLLTKQAELATDNAKRELDDYIQKNESKLDAEKFLSEQILEEERLRLEGIADQKKEFEQKRLEEGVVSQQEFNDAINAINEENRIANEELELERKEAKTEQDAIDFENRLALIEAQGASEFEMISRQLSAERAAELKDAEKTGADKNLINKKYNAIEKNLSRDLADFKKEQNAIILGGLKSLFGESSDIGKAFAVAEIANTTATNAGKAFAQAAVFASNPLTAPLAINAKIQGGIIIATGAAQAAKTAGLKFEKGGILRGSRHSDGGIPTRFGELEGGEAVINRKSTSMFAPLLSSINQAGGGRSFQDGGILGASASPISIIDYDLLAAKVAEANESIPPPVVSVEEISAVSGQVNVLESDTSI